MGGAELEGGAVITSASPSSSSPSESSCVQQRVRQGRKAVVPTSLPVGTWFHWLFDQFPVQNSTRQTCCQPKRIQEPPKHNLKGAVWFCWTLVVAVMSRGQASPQHLGALPGCRPRSSERLQGEGGVAVTFACLFNKATVVLRSPTDTGNGTYLRGAISRCPRVAQQTASSLPNRLPDPAPG